MDWNKYPNFSQEEFECSHTGRCEMQSQFLEILQEIRIEYAQSLIITSGYRDITHPEEIYKLNPGAHSFGVAADIAIRGVKALELLGLALKHGIRRVGLNQKGDARFIHLDIADKTHGFTRAIWTY